MSTTTNTTSSADWRTMALGLLALATAAGGGVGVGSTLAPRDEPEVIAYRLGRLEASVTSLSDDVKALMTATGDRYTRSMHDEYAEGVDDRLDRVEAVILVEHPR